MVGYSAMVKKDLRISDVKSSPFYDAQAEDISVAPLVHSVHPAAIVRAQQGSADVDDHCVLVKAMRGWHCTTASYSQDEIFLLRAIANTAQQVRLF